MIESTTTVRATLTPEMERMERLADLVGYIWWHEDAIQDLEAWPGGEALLREIPAIREIEGKLAELNARLRAQGFDNSVYLRTGFIDEDGIRR